MYRYYKALLQPTAKKCKFLTELFDVQHELYNAALEERSMAWSYNKRSVTKFEQFGQLKFMHELRPDLMKFGITVARGSLTRLDLAYQSFFRRVKAGEVPGHPRFKAKSRWKSVSWPEGAGWKLRDNDRLYVRGVGHIKYRGSKRGIQGIPKTLTIKREGRKWWALILCEIEAPEPRTKTGKRVGVDLGIANLLTTSDGQFVENPKFFAKGRDKLAKEQRELAKKTRGSTKRKKQVVRVGSAHRKIANQRRDYAHKVSRMLVDNYDLIVHEELKIMNMTGRVAPRPDPENLGEFLPNGQSVKSGLNRSINDAGWGQLLQFIAYKAEEAGREMIAVNSQYTSQTCSKCLHVAKENRVSQAEFRCQNCGYFDHADINAAKNILRVGLTQREALAGREVKDSTLVGSPTGPEVVNSAWNPMGKTQLLPIERPKNVIGA